MSTNVLRKTARTLASTLADLPQQMELGVFVVTPEDATKLLERNTKNRNLVAANAKRLAEQIERGAWRQVGDVIRVSKTGRLLDGQHRLQAVVLSGVAIELVVVFGLDDEAQDLIDVGAKRSLAQALALHGEANSTTLGAVVRQVFQILETSSKPGSWGPEPTYEEYADYVTAHPLLRDSAALGLKAQAVDVPASPFGAAHYVCALEAKDLADDFFSEICVPIQEGEVLQATVVDQARAAMARWTTRGGQSRMDQAALYDLAVRAFQDYADGSPSVSSYKIRRRPRSYVRPVVGDRA